MLDRLYRKIPSDELPAFCLEMRFFSAEYKKSYTVLLAGATEELPRSAIVQTATAD